MANVPGALLTCHDVSRPHCRWPVWRSAIELEDTRTHGVSCCTFTRETSSVTALSSPSSLLYDFTLISGKTHCLLLSTHCTAALVSASLLPGKTIHPHRRSTAEKHTPSETAAALLENGRLLLWNLPPLDSSTVATILASATALCRYQHRLDRSYVYLSLDPTAQVRINRSCSKYFQCPFPFCFFFFFFF